MSKKLKKNVPELRFPEFEVDWEKRSIGDYIEEYKKRVFSTTNLPIYTSSREGLKPQIEYFASREVANEGEYGVVPNGFFVYRHMSDDSVFKFNINETGKRIAVSKEYPVFTTTEKLNSKFLLCKLNYSKDFKQFAITQEKGGTRTRLYLKNLCIWNTLIPSIAEQEKMASFFGAVDRRLTQLRRKQELLQTYKRGVMQKIFSQEIRFKSAIGSPFPDWQKKKLGELGTFLGGGTPSTSQENYWTGKIPWISSSDLEEDSIYKISITRFINETAIKESATKTVPPNSILIISRVGVGKIAVSKQELCTSQDFSNFTPNQGNIYFIAYLLIFQKKNLLSISQGTSIKGFTNYDLSLLKIDFPCIEEQEKIANFLTAIDHKIETLTRHIDQTEQFKKGLLQKLFV
ncbi:MAG TPA: restriction endonuclease subunit S [Nodularia sp. (in: cyanobacteria)]|nr:restriction endonuclease subunit S [Nodularia sp. (in: cyanobacteria)]